MFISVSEVLVQLKKILKFLDLLYLQNWLFMFYIKTNQRLANSLVDLRVTTTTAIQLTKSKAKKVCLISLACGSYPFYTNLTSQFVKYIFVQLPEGLEQLQKQFSTFTFAQIIDWEVVLEVILVPEPYFRRMEILCFAKTQNLHSSGIWLLSNGNSMFCQNIQSLFFRNMALAYFTIFSTSIFHFFSFVNFTFLSALLCNTWSSMEIIFVVVFLLCYGYYRHCLANKTIVCNIMIMQTWSLYIFKNYKWLTCLFA